MRFALPLILFPLLSGNAIAAPNLHLHACPNVPAMCGYLTQPLDPKGQVPGTIDIHFELYPAHNQSQPLRETIVAVEGGPGFASIASGAGYLGLFYPLLENRNLLLVDNRGTGLSSAINCIPLQTEPVQTIADVGRCGNSLNPASDLFGTALATDDMAAILNAFGTGPVDLYGDSYGTWFSQAFAVNHPELTRAVILDSAYPVIGENPFYPFAGAFNRRNYNLVCQRSLNCPTASATAQQRIDALVETLRAHPFQGMGDDGNGNNRPVTADPTQVAYATYGGTMGPVIYRELDPAARAYLENGDAVPLLRILASNNLTSGFQQGGGPAYQYSRGLFAAVSCSDYPQLYNMTSPPADRLAQEQTAIAQELQTDPGVYAPFTIDEFRKASLDVSVLDLCLNWPSPSRLHPPQHSVPPEAVFPMVPVLVLSGELDSLTTPAEGRLASDLFPNGQQVLIANSFHVTAVGDLDRCASVIADTFFATLTPGDVSCASTITEVRMVPNFAVALTQVQPAQALPGNAGTPLDLQVAADATLAAGDLIARYYVNLSGSGVGLRGGTFSYTTTQAVNRFVFTGIQWTTDVSVSGTMTWDTQMGLITANLNVTGLNGESGMLTVTWMDRMPHSMATIEGQISGRAIAATTYAP